MAKKIKESDMYPSTKNALRRRYPLADGWKIIPQDNRGTYIPDFTVEKKARKFTYRIPVEVKLECKATQPHINQVNRYARNLAGPNIIIAKKFLVYPAGTNTTLIPNDIDVIYLREFTCE